jgi:hypothetical protein
LVWEVWVSLTASMSLLFFEHQGNDLWSPKGVVILDMGHHLTSHPTDLKVKIQTGKIFIEKNVCKQLKTDDTNKNKVDAWIWHIFIVNYINNKILKY